MEQKWRKWGVIPNPPKLITKGVVALAFKILGGMVDDIYNEGNTRIEGEGAPPFRLNQYAKVYLRNRAFLVHLNPRFMGPAFDVNLVKPYYRSDDGDYITLDPKLQRLSVNFAVNTAMANVDKTSIKNGIVEAHEWADEVEEIHKDTENGGAFAAADHFIEKDIDEDFVVEIMFHHLGKIRTFYKGTAALTGLASDYFVFQRPSAEEVAALGGYVSKDLKYFEKFPTFGKEDEHVKTALGYEDFMAVLDSNLAPLVHENRTLSYQNIWNLPAKWNTDFVKKPHLEASHVYKTMNSVSNTGTEVIFLASGAYGIGQSSLRMVSVIDGILKDLYAESGNQLTKRIERMEIAKKRFQIFYNYLRAKYVFPLLRFYRRGFHETNRKIVERGVTDWNRMMYPDATISVQMYRWLHGRIAESNKAAGVKLQSFDAKEVFAEELDLHNLIRLGDKAFMSKKKKKKK